MSNEKCVQNTFMVKIIIYHICISTWKTFGNEVPGYIQHSKKRDVDSKWELDLITKLNWYS